MTAIAAWPNAAQNWLDDRGRGAWIAALIAAFIVFWPLGLALLAYMIWSKRMFACSSRRHVRNERMEIFKSRMSAMRPSGNTAFDAYKTETLRRLEEEQKAFEDFLARLREAKDKAEFDQFMDERARSARLQDGDRPAGEA